MILYCSLILLYQHEFRESLVSGLGLFDRCTILPIVRFTGTVKIGLIWEH
jgi:hypothetical protein